jgi:flagellin-specific chaperone FliS
MFDECVADLVALAGVVRDADLMGGQALPSVGALLDAAVEALEVAGDASEADQASAAITYIDQARQELRRLTGSPDLGDGNPLADIEFRLYSMF